MVINLFPDLLPCSEAELSVKEKKNKRGGKKRKRISKEINSKKIFLVITTSSSKDLDEVQNFSQVILVFNINDAGLYFGTKKKSRRNYTTILGNMWNCRTSGFAYLQSNSHSIFPPHTSYRLQQALIIPLVPFASMTYVPKFSLPLYFLHHILDNI